jgi:ATP-dependent helicase HrpA
VRLFRIEQADQVAYVQKRPPLNPMLQLTLSALDSGFLNDFMDTAIFSALTKNGEVEIRTREAFAARAAEARAELYAAAADQAQALEEILEQRNKIFQTLETLSGAQREDPELQLDFLFRPGFLTTPDLYSRYPRYLRALSVRLQRLVNNPDADAKKFAEVEPFQNRLTELLLDCRQLSGAWQLIELAMMLEEFRINRFAPEVGTPFKISAKRLDELFSRYS